MTEAASQPLLSIRNLTKYFGASAALDNVSLSVGYGEIRGLVGQNGSGKSTLIKLLAGYHSQDLQWRLELPGKELTRALHPGEITAFGVAFVHQDLGVLGDLSVLENLLLTELATDHRRYIGWGNERAKAKAIFKQFGLDLEPAAKLSTLRPVEQAQVAIVRAVLQLRSAKQADHPGVLVLDEATTFLDRAGREGMYDLLRAVAAEGSGVVFVSHDINEVLTVCDAVTVLRDGRVVADAPRSELTHDDLVSLIVTGKRGVEVVSRPARRAAVLPASSSQASLEVEHLSGDLLNDVSLTVHPGEIVGVTGIVGSGWELVVEYICGARRAESGSCRLGGKTIALEAMSPDKALALSMVYVPSDRLREAVVPDLSLRENVMQPVLDNSFEKGLLRLRRLTVACKEVLERYAVAPAEPSMPIGLLSGGNQQKAVLAKWLQTDPLYVLLNEPTQGVDIGARQRIYELVRAAATRGAAVIYASADWEEVAGISDLVVVISEGRVAERLEGARISVDAIAQAAYLGMRRSADLSKAAALLEDL